MQVAKTKVLARRAITQVVVTSLRAGYKAAAERCAELEQQFKSFGVKDALNPIQWLTE